MLIRMTDLDVNIPEETNKKLNEIAKNFAKASGTKHYEEDRNAEPSKAEKDIALGKKGEYFALLGLCQHYKFPWIKIDMQIREGKEKGWRVDLPFSQEDKTLPDVHVKTCDKKTYKICEDFSWTFNLGNKRKPGGRDPILDLDNVPDLIVLVYADYLTDNNGKIKMILPWVKAKPYLKGPKLDEYRDIKTCLYYEDLKEECEKLLVK